MSLKPQSSAHGKHVLTYHLVWCVKYRRTILTHEIGDRVKELLHEIAAKIGAEIIETETDTDHVHVIVRLKPTHTISGVFHRFKGGTARQIFLEFPELKNRLWGGHLWQPSYYAATVGGAPLETLKKYVEEQRTK